jgi:hypothetical protein
MRPGLCALVVLWVLGGPGFPSTSIRARIANDCHGRTRRTVNGYFLGRALDLDCHSPACDEGRVCTELRLARERLPALPFRTRNDRSSSTRQVPFSALSHDQIGTSQSTPLGQDATESTTGQVRCSRKPRHSLRCRPPRNVLAQLGSRRLVVIGNGTRRYGLADPPRDDGTIALWYTKSLAK